MFIWFGLIGKSDWKNVWMWIDIYIYNNIIYIYIYYNTIIFSKQSNHWAPNHQFNINWWRWLISVGKPREFFHLREVRSFGDIPKFFKMVCHHQVVHCCLLPQVFFWFSNDKQSMLGVWLSRTLSGLKFFELVLCKMLTTSDLLAKGTCWCEYMGIQGPNAT